MATEIGWFKKIAAGTVKAFVVFAIGMGIGLCIAAYKEFLHYVFGGMNLVQILCCLAFIFLGLSRIPRKKIVLATVAVIFVLASIGSKT